MTSDCVTSTQSPDKARQTTDTETFEYYSPRRYVGLRISLDAEAALAAFQKMEWENPYFYGHHSPDSGCKHHHTHFVILRDWDPRQDEGARAKALRRKYVAKTELKGNQYFAISFHTNTLIEAGNYISHDPETKITFSEGHDWKGFDQFRFQYKEYASSKSTKPDTDIENRRRDMDAIPLSRYNLVSTMQRYDRINKRPKRPFKTALKELLVHTRYRPNKELLELTRMPQEYIDEYEKGPAAMASSWVDRVCP